jgi:hypothetical protein
MLNNKTRTKIKKHFGKLNTYTPMPESVDIDFSVDNFTSIQKDNVGVLSDALEEVDVWSYVGEDKMSMEEIPLNENQDVKIIIYSIDNHSLKPFLLFLLEKKNNKLSFIEKKYKKNHKVLLKDINIFPEQTPEYQYQGWYKTDEEVYLFFQIEQLENPVKITSKTKYLQVLSSEIINYKETYNFIVSNATTDFFINNSDFLYLYDGNMDIIETPAIGYYGNYYKRIASTTVIGDFAQPPTASLGPYYYFGTFNRALRYACITSNYKEKVIGELKLTRKNTPIWKKGGIVKFVLFMGNSTIFLDRPDDPDDNSLVSIELYETSEMARKTKKTRDADGKWTQFYDSVYQPMNVIKLKDKTITLDPQIIVKEDKQQYPMSYVYIDTENVIYKKQKDYDISNYTIE